MRITEREEIVTIFNGAESLSLFHISDIHLWRSTKVLDQIRDLIHKNEPDLIVATGDYYDLPIGAANFRNFLLEICKTYTVIFIKGNHDGIYGKRVLNLLSGIENCFSVDQSVYRYCSKAGNIFNFASWKSKDLLPHDKKETNIVLIHNPEKIDSSQLKDIQLILAGHLHGGQFIFGKTKRNANFPGCILYKYCTDRTQLHHTTLIVSKGLGDTFPFRWNCPKEVVNIIIE